MKFCKLLSMVAIAVLALGITAGVANADGSDPKGTVHSPVAPGTPGVGIAFQLDPFGPIAPGGGTGLCTFANNEEDCTVKNLSGFNWTDIEVVLGAPVGGSLDCSDITLGSDLFTQTSCADSTGGVTLSFLGVSYSPGAQSFIETANLLAGNCPSPSANCLTGGQIEQLLQTTNPQGYQPYCSSDASGGQGGTPGVLAGCDVEFSFGIGADGGNWPLGTTFSASAPEPSTISLMGMGLFAMLFLGNFYKKSQTQN
jgi:hypothetical protein